MAKDAKRKKRGTRATGPETGDPPAATGSLSQGDVGATRSLYEHARLAADRDTEAYGRYLTKVRYLMTVDVALAASLAYGVAHSSWIVRENSACYWIIFVVLGLVSGASIALSLLFALYSYKTRPISVVGLTAAHRLLKDERIGSISEFNVTRQLGAHLIECIDSNREIQRAESRWADRQFVATFAALLATGAFLLFTILGDLIAGGGNV